MIFLDTNAGAPLRPEIARHLAGAFDDLSGNPSSVHAAGRAARRRLDQARLRVAQSLGCLPREITFTGSGSEANALAVLGAFAARREPRRTRVVSSAIEHPCVLGALKRLEAGGAEVLRLKPDASGRVPVGAFRDALTEETALCSLMAVNNETGVIQPAGEVARLCAARGIVFHCDAVQALGKLPATLREIPADLLAISSHKLGGPSGSGVLFCRRGIAVQALVPGHQENGHRGGTPSVPLAEALALALELSLAELEAEGPRVAALRDRFEAQVLRQLPGVFVNGTAARVGNTSNLRFEGVDGEALLIALDLEGICVSTGAACASGTLEPSHVLLAMGLGSSHAHESVRFSLGAQSTGAELDTVVAALVRHVPRIRAEPA